MEENKRLLTSDCSFMNVKPIMVDLPYPKTQVRERNLDYANLISMDYCGSVSELSAITQYINNENRMFCDRCPMAKTIIGIAMAEMMHLQKLGELITLLGGTVDFSAKYNNGKQVMWTPECLTIPKKVENMLLADIESERDAISQYRKHIKLIDDDCVNAVLERIIKDEEYHIFILQVLLEEL